ncbi:MAG: hypothetical protein U0167_18015 [bacterium]
MIALLAPGLPALLLGVSAAAAPPPSMVAALREELPGALAAAAPPDSLQYAGPEGAFQLVVGEMNGAPPAEGLLIVRPADKPVRVVFLGEADGKSVRKTVKLPKDEAGEVSAQLVAFAEGKALGQIRGASGSSVLVSWDGGKCEVVWSSEKGTQDTRWFELEDLDGDHTREIVTYQRRAIDASAEDEFVRESQGAAPTEEASAVAVLKWTGSKWEKDDELLSTRH